MVEAILLQIPPPVQEVVQVCSVYYCNRLMYVKQLLLHHLIISLLDLIQSPYHGIIVTLVAKCPLHVHQQVLHRDVLALIQHVGPFTRVPPETGKDVGAHTSLIILLKKGVYIEAPEHVHHPHPWIGQLKDQHIQSCRCQPFPLPTLSAASVPMPVAHSLTHSGVSIRVWYSPVWGGRGQTPSTDCSALGLWWPSMWLRCPSMGGESCLSPLPHPRGSSILLRCTSHQLARGVRLLCHSNWCIMGRVLGPTSEPSAVGGSDRPLPGLHQREEANVEVGRVQNTLQKDLHVGSDSIRGILLQTPMALLVVEEQVSSTRAIYLHMF